jgi:hypothetical protein
VFNGDRLFDKFPRTVAMRVLKSNSSSLYSASRAFPTQMLKSVVAPTILSDEAPRIRSSCVHLPADQAASAAYGSVLIESELVA